jgi:predicted nucleotidyltransferase
MNDDLIQDIVRRFLSVSNPQRIIVFGSRARGDARPDSDVDVMVVEEGPFGPPGSDHSRLAEWKRLYHSLWGCGAAVDLVLYTAEEVEGWQGVANHLIHQALREGRVVHGRA